MRLYMILARKLEHTDAPCRRMRGTCGADHWVPSDHWRPHATRNSGAAAVYSMYPPQQSVNRASREGSDAWWCAQVPTETRVVWLETDDLRTATEDPDVVVAEEEREMLAAADRMAGAERGEVPSHARSRRRRIGDGA